MESVPDLTPECLWLVSEIPDAFTSPETLTLPVISTSEIIFIPFLSIQNSISPIFIPNCPTETGWFFRLVNVCGGVVESKTRLTTT